MLKLMLHIVGWQTQHTNISNNDMRFFLINIFVWEMIYGMRAVQQHGDTTLALRYS